ncbi:FG-GAP repeat domain-containing protein [Pseudoprimorskyibacter insulae]|uniref:VCBS repeat-containing protein n=1 Tax=Pseudoprimorskyibacter insulae TaxID=1695997 RepID=A0A2R8AYM3_9RHOB|nr:VCBS repeat-containing protein [Pseudoprimorskyibacter insulae]SPF81067.1 hypothetical protein PRI8871_02884 [Pseudoprimorskyibacter insulae]
MAGKARHVLLRACRATARRAGPVLGFWLAALAATASADCPPDHLVQPMAGRSAAASVANQHDRGLHAPWAEASAQLSLTAALAVPTDEYGHGILGDLRDAKALIITLGDPATNRIACPARVSLPKGEVFEDIAPRLADLTGDGLPEIITVQSSIQSGARLVIYDAQGTLLAATKPIGRRNRWLAPIGVADFDGDGAPDIAYIDRPHLAKRLTVWRWQSGKLTPMPPLDGVTNHQIGWAFIAGGIRNCGPSPELILSDGNWRNTLAIKWSGTGWSTKTLATHATPASLAQALTCP